MKEAKAQAKATAAAEEIKQPEEMGAGSFSKEQLLASKRFRGKRDIVDALLLPDKTYTVKEVEGMIEKYRKGKVK